MDKKTIIIKLKQEHVKAFDINNTLTNDEIIDIMHKVKATALSTLEEATKQCILDKMTTDVRTDDVH